MTDLIVILGPILLGFFVGRFIESKHYASIKKREAALRQKPVVTIKRISNPEEVETTALVQGSAVIAIDGYKRVLAVIVNFFGGEVHAYSSLIDRARREALLRMMESAPWADAYFNLRIETSTIAKGQPGKNSAAVEVLAYSTAVKRIRA